MADTRPPVPRGIEVLVKKASVDAEFRALLLAKRAEAAAEIGLALDPAEAAMLQAIPAAQLEATIEHTTVNPMTRAAFLGKAAALMLAALGAQAGADGPPPPGGIAPDRPPVSRGIMPNREQFILYNETDYKGEVSSGVVDNAAFVQRLAAVARTNAVLQKAYLAAVSAWEEKEALKGIPFPLRSVEKLQCNRAATFDSRERAEEMLKQRQAELDKKLEAARKAEQDRLAALSEEDRVREKEKADLLKAACQVFEEKLKQALDAAGALTPHITRGISPDRPMGGTGIRP